ncbi:hypothetical protein [Mesobaculum littorinae]|uniref:hypothetical protein n=1 Tax=Mesobaculum littorinae TaxID=2486419 RepID=UPI001F278227|nr:hypothetical protein [Mesobaculum littorinae]
MAGAGTDDDAEAQRARRVQTLEDRIAELEAAVNARAFEFEPDGSEDTEQHRPTRILSRTPQAPRDDHPGPEASSAGHPEGANDPAAPVGDPDATHAPSFRELLERETRSVLHTVIDFEEAAARNVNASGAVEEGPTDADGHDDAAWEAAEWQVESWEGDAQSSIDWTPTTAEAADEGEWDETDDLIAGLIYGGDDGAAPGAQAHADVGEGAEDAELFADAEESYRAEARRFDAALARSFEAEAPTHRQDALDAAPGVPSPPAEPEVDMSEEAVLDEETLRDMVAEIVREELQGALGERITRNVRKLVRREIMRAISIRDFQ